MNVVCWLKITVSHCSVPRIIVIWKETLIEAEIQGRYGWNIQVTSDFILDGFIFFLSYCECYESKYFRWKLYSRRPARIQETLTAKIVAKHFHILKLYYSIKKLSEVTSS